MRIDLPQNVNFIIDTLYEHGFEAYAVGGCVRDLSLIHIYGEALNLKHYVVITQNYNIDIVTEWEPTIEISKM